MKYTQLCLSCSNVRCVQVKTGNIYQVEKYTILSRRIYIWNESKEKFNKGVRNGGGRILRGAFASVWWKLERRFGGVYRWWVELAVGASDPRHARQLWVELSFCARTLWIPGGKGAAQGWCRAETRAIHLEKPFSVPCFPPHTFPIPSLAKLRNIIQKVSHNNQKQTLHWALPVSLFFKETKLFFP